MDGDYLLDGLNQAQLEAVTTPGGPLVVLAAAGSGKTRVLTRRIAWRLAQGEMNPDRVLALTFTRRAAEELRRRQRQLGQRDRILAGTFHAIALNQLRLRWAEQRRTPPKILDSKARIVRHICKELGLAKSSGGSRNEGSFVDITTELDWAQARVVSAADYPNAAELANRQSPVDPAQMAAVIAAYEQEKKRRRVVDFDDLLVLAIAAMRQDPTYAAAVRWRHSHLYVDEFQDINPLQFELLSEWRKDNDDLFVVGDPNQAIYGWNGADPELLNRFTDREPTAKVVHLTENYRSSPHILKLARTALTAPRSEPTTSRTDGLIPTIERLPDDQAEAQHIADKIRQFHGMGDAWSDQAVLTRTNGQLTVIAEALTAVGIPARQRVGDGPLRHPAIRTELQAISRPGADLKTWVEQTQNSLAEPRDGLPPQEETRLSNLASLLRLVEEYVETEPTPNGPGLASWVGILKPDDVDSDDDSVDLLTFHSCKGLEWPTVHIAGLEDGFVPIAYAATGEQRNEEKRLLYVALTRAQDNMHLTSAASRDFKGRTSRRKVSPYVDGLRQALQQCEDQQRQRPDWRAKLSHSRQVLETAGDDPQLEAASSHADPNGKTSDVGEQRAAQRRREALLEWRKRKARAASVDPSVILDDRLVDSLIDLTREYAANNAGAYTRWRDQTLQDEVATANRILNESFFSDVGLSRFQTQLYAEDLALILSTSVD